MNPTVTDVVNTICKSRHCIALTGAGISTLSGIPDFRSPGTGLWNRFDAEKIFLIDHFYKEPDYFFNFAKEFIYTMADAQPNIIHTILASLQNKGLIKRIITQNIDMLHQKAGSSWVVELHGSPVNNYCIQCRNFYSFDEMFKKIERDTVPRCDVCRSIIKPDITFFGELLKEDVLQAAFFEAEKTDCCIVLGSSLVVHPAALLPDMAKRNGGTLIIVNRDMTPYDSRADMVFNMDLEDFGNQMHDLLKERNLIEAT